LKKNSTNKVAEKNHRVVDSLHFGLRPVPDLFIQRFSQKSSTIKLFSELIKAAESTENLTQKPQSRADGGIICIPGGSHGQDEPEH
jgi:hypothetical protein